jgi:hypothetical protein
MQLSEPQGFDESKSLPFPDLPCFQQGNKNHPAGLHHLLLSDFLAQPD